MDLNTGNPENVLVGPHKILLSENLAKTYFKDSGITGKRIEMAGIWDEGFKDYEVSGVFRDFPSNSHIHPEILVSMEDSSRFEGWTYTYLLLKQGSLLSSIYNHFNSFAVKYLPADERASSRIHLQDLSQIHLFSDKDREIENNGDYRLVLFFSGAGLAIFCLALFNTINLSLALALRRNKTKTVERIFGAGIMTLLTGIFLESFLILGCTTIVALAILLLILLGLNDFLPAEIIKETWATLTLWVLPAGILSCLAITLPQLLIFAKPLKGLNPFFSSPLNLAAWVKTKNSGLKKILVIIQFTASVILIICGIYFTRQKNYLMQHRMGAGDSPIVLLNNLNWQIKDRYFEFKQLALENHRVRDVTGMMEEPSAAIMDAMPFTMDGIPQDGNKLALYVDPVDENFFDFFRLELIAGHNFQPYPQDSANEGYILNETALKYLGIRSPEEAIGRSFKPLFGTNGIFRGGRIIGVVRDFCFSTMKERIKPVVFFQKPIWYWNFLVRIDGPDIPESIGYLKSIWDKVYPEYVFDYTFTDQTYREAYRKEIMQSKLSGYFMVLALIISALGLYGLASVIIEQRTREVGIRKVIGATTMDILFMLHRDFTRWVMVAVMLAIPLAWYVLHRWNENYAYRADLSWWIFAAAGLAAFLVAWFAVGYRTLKASRKNPVESLRHE